MSKISLSECVDLEHALEKTIRTGPRFVDTQRLALLLGPDRVELAERMVQVPGNELKLVGRGMQIDNVVLPHGQEAIHRADPDGHGHEPREFLDLQVRLKLLGEFRIVGVGHELAEGDHASCFLVGDGCLGIIRLLIGLPIVPHVFKHFLRHRLEDRAFLRAEPILGKVVVDVLDQRIKSEELVVVPTRHCHVDLGIGRARRRHAGVAKEPIGQHFVHPTGVGDVAVKVELAHAMELAAGEAFVQIHFQGTLEGTAGLQKRPIALVTHRHVAQYLTVEVQVGPHRGEVHPHHRHNPVSLPFGCSKIHSWHRVRWRSATRRSHSRRRAKPSGRCHGHIQAFPDTVVIQRADVFHIPSVEPTTPQRQELLGRQLPILVRVSLHHKHGGNEHAWPKSAGTQGSAWPRWPRRCSGPTRSTGHTRRSRTRRWSAQGPESTARHRPTRHRPTRHRPTEG